MAKQISHVKATGTVCGDINFYKDVDWGFLVRMLPGVDSSWFWKDPAFEGSRRSAERFKQGNIMSSIIYRFVPVKRMKRSSPFHFPPMTSVQASTGQPRRS